MVEPEIPGWLIWLSKFLGDVGGLSVIGKLLMWGALLALLLLLVYWLATMDVGRISARLRKRFRPHAVSDGPASPRGAQADWLETADSLAGEGRYAAAIHALLLGVLGWMRTSSSYDWPPRRPPAKSSTATRAPAPRSNTWSAAPSWPTLVDGLERSPTTWSAVRTQGSTRRRSSRQKRFEHGAE